MAFVASPNLANQASISSGAGSVLVPVPQVADASGNGFRGNLFSHYQVGPTGPAFAIDPQLSVISVPQGAAVAILYFGSMQS